MARSHPAATVAALTALALLAGCAGYSKRHFTTGSVPDHYKSRHPIVVSQAEQTLDVPVATGMVDLPLASESAVEGFVGKFRRASSGTMTVMAPSGSPNQNAAYRVAQRIVEVAHREGVPPSRVRLTRYGAGAHGPVAPVRLSYHAVQAKVESRCGEWPEDLGDTSAHRNYHNFGCAYQNNLAAQVSNPADLLGPRGESPIDAQRRTTVIEAYREGEATQSSPLGGGTASDLGSL